MQQQIRVPAPQAAPRQAAARSPLDADAADRDFVMSFARGLQVLSAFAHRERAQTIAEISMATRIPRSAVRRLLHTLQVLGYVGVDDGRFQPTARALTLGNAYLSGTALGRAAMPQATRLSAELDCVCLLTVADGDHTLIVATAGVRMKGLPKTLLPTVGGRAPLYCGASGLLFLSAWSDDAVDAYLDRVALAPYTQRTPTIADDLRQRVLGARQQRHAVCDRTFTQQHRSLAVPVLDRLGRIIAALVVVVDAERVTPARLLSDALPRVSIVARELSAELR